ncbi:hypothetical protein GLOTRDRAFT_130508 [Gloeophyllum trabeum ATCC 11539]|uniref:Uncharacterized protein n=1 Tax=Gloeophyllum trabeum (strain ATCC 11539 / FP-39264 / Madison 617) TaxID=670483 RepID=S7Q3V1_GLOTA|nr:uncharacterized protein GLOTRDRAFT_130508 [Gloeophyllum trabeum ATCC 11539]EPQ54123.1 hypothetical protein GLOTRDRAFT_130508 [Gloeophyllum trabeum ATCC 11539]
MDIKEFKKNHISSTGQKANTWMRSLYTHFNLKMLCAAQRYRSACTALESLDALGDWCNQRLILCDEDIQGPGKEEDEKAKEKDKDNWQSCYEISWIWTVRQGSMGDSSEDGTREFNDSMCMEWVKAKA